MEPLEGIKPIGCKWIYKKNRGADGKVETFKARPLAKGFIHKEGSIMRKLFFPVAMLKSIQILYPLQLISTMKFGKWM